MIIEFEKDVTLFAAIVYMKIKKDVSREDIREYLNGKRFDNNLINNRVDTYLKEIKIFDEEGQLTHLGERVRQRGYLPTPEEGKYKIWYTQDDDFWGNKILFFRREKPNEKSNVEKSSVSLSNNDVHFLMPAQSANGATPFAEFRLIDPIQIAQSNSYQQDTIQIKLRVEKGKQSQLSFSGSLEKNSIQLDDTIKTDRDETIDEILQKSLPDFDMDENRLRIPFHQEYKDFEIKNYPCKWKGFSGRIDSVKLMPSDNEEAKKWRDYLLKERVNQQYLSPGDFASVANSINEVPAFNRYKEELDIPKSKEFITGTRTGFWHLNAPIDLNPLGSSNINEVVSLQKNETVSFSDILYMLGIVPDNNMVVYYDKYVIDERKQKNAAAFMDALRGKKSIIITESPQNLKSDFIMHKRKDIRLQDLKSGIFNRSPLHDRYLIVESASGIKFWNISNSLDFIRFNDSEIGPDTKGKIIQPVTFTPITNLDKELLNFVNKERNGK